MLEQMILVQTTQPPQTHFECKRMFCKDTCISSKSMLATRSQATYRKLISQAKIHTLIFHAPKIHLDYGEK